MWKWLLLQSQILKWLWFLFFVTTSVQRQGVTDDFLELVPPHPFTRAFFFCSLFLLFSHSLFLSLSLSLHQHTTNDIIIWAFHSLLALCIDYMCVQYCACISISLSQYYMFITVTVEFYPYVNTSTSPSPQEE